MSNQEQVKIACCQLIYNSFIRYNKDFHRITKRARTRFEQRDWKGHQQDIVDRINLYDKSVNRVILLLRKQILVDDQIEDHKIWHEIKQYFGERLINVPDAGFIKTFFNSITRRVFSTLGVDPLLEFIDDETDTEADNAIKSLNIHRYPYWQSLSDTFKNILKDFAFRVPYDDLEKNTTYISNEIEDFFQQDQILDLRRFEFIDSFFYQAARAYLVGRIIMAKGIVLPIVIAFKNDGHISADAVLLDENRVSIVFGYTRSYYFADPNSVIGAVHFLHSILNNKPLDELYTVLGRVRQGKTERQRIFSQHMAKTDDKFVHAEGDEGLVMIVFTLPSYNLVFKVIRDRAGYPKTVTPNQVIEKYRLVSKHDRAGRLIDTQEFRNLAYPVSRFSDSLLNDLLTLAADNVSIKDEAILLKRVYIERRVRPLNLYVREAGKAEAEKMVIDYGQAIRDLAQTNIFPGDLLLKNFGVTRHHRIVFYDYDEVSLVTDCCFREIPQDADPIDEMRAEPHYHVGENDIFPEELVKFLAMPDSLKEVFTTYHQDLLTANYWREIKVRHLAKEVSLVVPYESPVPLLTK